MTKFVFDRVEVGGILDQFNLKGTGIGDECVTAYCHRDAILKIVNKYKVLQGVMTQDEVDIDSASLDDDFLQAAEDGI